MRNLLTPDQKDAAISGSKIIGSWTAVEVTDWSQMASKLAAMLTLLFILEFLWKKVLRPFAVWRGWLKPKRRRGYEVESDHMDLDQ